MERNRWSVRLPEELEKRVERAALGAGLNRSDYLRKVLRDSVSDAGENEALKATVAKLHNRITTLQNSLDMMLSMLSLFVRRWYTHQRPITDKRERSVAEAIGERAHRAFLRQLLENPELGSELLESEISESAQDAQSEEGQGREVDEQPEPFDFEPAPEQPATIAEVAPAASVTDTATSPAAFVREDQRWEDWSGNGAARPAKRRLQVPAGPNVPSLR